LQARSQNQAVFNVCIQHLSVVFLVYCQCELYCFWNRQRPKYFRIIKRKSAALFQWVLALKNRNPKPNSRDVLRCAAGANELRAAPVGGHIYHAFWLAMLLAHVSVRSFGKR